MQIKVLQEVCFLELFLQIITVQVFLLVKYVFTS